MKTKHIFVPALDVGEILPFVIKKTKNLKDSISEQERARRELERFIDSLERNYREPIWYMGMDVISGKTYERFIFEKGGFFEIMIEAPLALNAHFVHDRQAKKFQAALIKTLKKMLARGPVREMFIESIQVQSEEQEDLTYRKWTSLKQIRGKK